VRRISTVLKAPDGKHSNSTVPFWVMLRQSLLYWSFSTFHRATSPW